MKPVHWISSCLRDLKSFPEVVRQEVGFSIYLAQLGDRAANVVSMVGFQGKVLEVVVDDGGETYRAIYTVRFAKAIYAIHAFQKKSKKGIATPKPELDLIEKRLKTAAEHYKANYETKRKEQTHGHGA